jgi:hypothetical protein
MWYTWGKWRQPSSGIKWPRFDVYRLDNITSLLLNQVTALVLMAQICNTTMHDRNVFPRERSRTLFVFLLAWHGEGALTFLWSHGGWLKVYLETKGTCKALFAQIVCVLCSNVLHLKKCVTCYQNSSVVMYHVGGWFLASDFLISQEVGWFTSRMIFQHYLWGTCIWSSIMKLIYCLLPSYGIWFLILQDHGAPQAKGSLFGASILATESMAGTVTGRMPWLSIQFCYKEWINKAPYWLSILWSFKFSLQRMN